MEINESTPKSMCQSNVWSPMGKQKGASPAHWSYLPKKVRAQAPRVWISKKDAYQRNVYSAMQNNNNIK